VTKGHPVNLVASVRQRLLNLSRARKEDFTLTLTQYAIERLLYRLSRSEYAERFMLKGAMLFAVWAGRPFRPTRDLDLLGYGESSGDELTRLFAAICRTSVEPDGLEFDPQTIKATEIREDQECQGQRVHLDAALGRANISVQVDVGFGDGVIPSVEEIEYPTLIGFPAPLLRAYPKETVVAEKFQAIVAFGVLNSRMKDFYDVWILAQEFPFDGPRLCRAMQATFERRQGSGTSWPLPHRMPPQTPVECRRARSLVCERADREAANRGASARPIQRRSR